MRGSTLAVAAVTAATLVSSGFTFASASAHPSPSGMVGVVAATPLSAEAAKGLAFSREEERMARDLYAHFAARYEQARPFSNIVSAEQRHFDAVGSLLARYGITDPSAGKSAGTYAEAEVQKLYDQWKRQGQVSWAAAVKVGAELETRDIADLKRIASTPLPNDVSAVYAALLRGSENHLAAFTRVSQRTAQRMPGQGPAGGQRQGPGRDPSPARRGGPGHGGDRGTPAQCPLAS